MTTETSTPPDGFMRNLEIASRLRRIFGERWSMEPCFSFTPDGSVRVTGGNRHVEDLSPADVASLLECPQTRL